MINLDQKAQDKIFSRLASQLKEDYSNSFLEYPITVQDTYKAKYLDLLGLKESDLVLDTGCYAGYFASFLSKKFGSRVIGSDLSLTCIKYCIKCDRYSNRFCVADLEDLPFAKDSFDAVLCIGVLEHTPDARRALSEIYRVMKPGGRLVIHLPLKDHKYTFLWLLERMMPKKMQEQSLGIGHDFRKIPTHDEIISLLKENRFLIQEAERIGFFLQPFHDWCLVPFLHQKVFEPLKRLAGRMRFSRNQIRMVSSRAAVPLAPDNIYGSGLLRKIYSLTVVAVVKKLILIEKLLGLKKGYAVYILVVKR
ncbi:class I SAM-dependent methyltransferase [Candidatus Omnitrophota bacterium]